MGNTRTAEYDTARLVWRAVAVGVVMMVGRRVYVRRMAHVMLLRVVLVTVLGCVVGSVWCLAYVAAHRSASRAACWTTIRRHVPRVALPVKVALGLVESATCLWRGVPGAAHGRNIMVVEVIRSVLKKRSPFSQTNTFQKITWPTHHSIFHATVWGLITSFVWT